MTKNIVAFDIETTGLDKNKDHIIQISMVKFDSSTYEIVDTYSTYIRPIGEYVMSIPAYLKHKLKPNDLIDKPTINDVADKIIEFFADCDVLTYNGNKFDIPFLNNELAIVNKHVDFTSRNCYDSCLEERRRNPNNLESVYKRYVGQTMEETGYQAHDALSDVNATIKIFEHQMNNENFEPDKIYGDSGMVTNQEFEGRILPCFSYGKYRSVPLQFVKRIDENYIKWTLSGKSGIDNDTKKFIEEYLYN